MWEKSKPIPSRLKTVLYLAIILLTLATVTPVLADYLGPDRTVTQSSGSCKVVLYQCSFVPAKGIYKYKSSSTWSCSNESKPWLAYPSSGPACNQNNKGAKYWKKVDDSQEQTVTYPPATIEGFLQNCSPNNGWCTTFPQFSLSADEPLSNYDITAIEGTWNGQNFACPDSDCSVPLIEGDNALTYWALSSWGDSSTMGSMTVKVDSQQPVISGAFNGTTGSNGWYVGPVSFTGSAADATSGLASFTCTLDGAALASCTSIDVNDEGPHTLVLTALDNAGNSSMVVQDTSIDSRPPTLSSSLQGSLGSNSWYNDAELHVSASDPIPGSGVFALDYSIDGTAWIAFPSSGVLDLPDGKHSVDVHVVDRAGHSVSSSKSFWLDSLAPDVILDPQGTLGANGWYVTNLNLSASASDDTSGLDIFEYAHNSSTWTTYTSPLALGDGSHAVSFWAQDTAGLVTQVDQLYLVDTVHPQIAGTLSGIPGTNGWYTSDVILSASAADPLPGSGVDAFSYILDGGSETPYTNALTIPDGVHVIRLNVQDKAGLTYFTEQSVKVDTLHPSLSIQTTLPAWVNGKVTLNGASEDGGSGISKVEISTNGGQTWRVATGTTSWSYEWDTSGDSNGSHNVIVRATDQAGLASQQTVITAVDNQAPNIQLRSQWLSWQIAILDIWDYESGIAEARLEILDPEKRWPRRLIQLTAEEFPMHFKWDRRFGDDTIAPNGDYVALVTAIDQLGNVSQQYSTVSVVIDILPAGPTSTPQPYYRVDPAPVFVSTPVPVVSPVATSMAVVSVFGEIQPTVDVTPTPEAALIPRPTPTQTGFVEWLESVLIPRPELTNQTTGFNTLTAQPSTSSVPGTTSNILWGAAAAAMVGAVTSYALEEKRKREESIAAKRAEEAALEERKSKIKVRKMKKLEEKWAQERDWELARLTEQAKDARIKAKLTQREIEDEIAWTTLQNALQQRAEEKRHFDKLTSVEETHIKLDTYVESRSVESQPETATPGSNWWEKTKSFVNDNILEPWDQYVYEPIVKPLTEKRNEVLKDTVSWLNTNVYQPFMAERVDNTLNNLKNNATWINETIIQPWVIPFGKEFVGVLSDIGNWVNTTVIEPYVVPFVTKSVEYAIKDFARLNETVLQPYLLPALEKLNEKVYQPYLAPIVDVAADLVTGYTELITEHVYEPIFAPIVNDINKYIVKPYVDPAVAWWDKTWDEYGEWVHNGLDAVGFVPGLGDIMDGVNGLIYLAEGRYLEASISAAAMIPVLGDLAKAGKFGLKVGAEIVEEAAEKLVKEVIEEGTEQATKEIAENIAQKTAVGAAEELSEKAATEALENTAAKTVNEAAEGLTAKTLADSVTNTAENLAQKTADDIAAKAAKDASQAVVSTSTKQVSKEVKEELVQQALKQTDDKTAKIIRSLERKLGDDTVSLQKGINLLQKHGDAAIKAFNGVNQEAAQKLLKNLNEDILDFAIKEGSGAFEALSRWPESDLAAHGVELALRAKKDAMVLEATRKLVALGPFDPAHITSQQRKLINQIAENSIIYGDEAQAVIGKYVNVDSGFLGLAKQTGSLHYSPHPDVWNTLGKLGTENQDKVAWLVNQQAIQTGISKGLPFECTLSGLPKDIINREKVAISKLFNGGTETELKKILRLGESDLFPFRIRELQELQQAGYDLTWDTSTYILVKP